MFAAGVRPRQGDKKEGNVAMKFTGLTEDEVAHARELVKSGRCSYRVARARSIRAEFFTQSSVGDAWSDGDHNFTIAVLYVIAGKSSKPTIMVGVAKRDPRDKPDVRRGRMIALARALAERALVLTVADLDMFDN